LVIVLKPSYSNIIFAIFMIYISIFNLRYPIVMGARGEIIFQKQLKV
jgi:hypothetical protein